MSVETKPSREIGRPVRRFEDLVAWQRARDLTREVYAITRDARVARDFGFSNQIQRAAVSVMSNIAEGAERMHSREYHQMLCTAKASCAEVRSLLYVASDIGYISESQFTNLMALAEETARIIGGLRASIAKRLTA